MRKRSGSGCWPLSASRGSHTPLQAGHCGVCRYPRPCVTPEQCCPPVVTSTVQYQPVIEKQEQVCYRPVYKTCYQAETYTTYKHRPGDDLRRREVHRPAARDRVLRHGPQLHRSTTGVRNAPAEPQCYTVMRPVTQTFQVAIPYCTQRPVYETHYREVPTPSAGRSSRNTGRDPVLHQRPVYEQHVRTHMLHREPAGGPGVPGAGYVHRQPPGVRAAHPRDPVHDLPQVVEPYTVQIPYTIHAAGSTSSTSASSATCTYRTETQQYQVAVPYTTYRTGPGAADLLRAGHDLPGPRSSTSRRRASTTSRSRSSPSASRRSAPAHYETVTEYIPGPVVTQVRADARHVRVRPLHLHEPLLPRPGRPAAGAVPRPDGLQEGLGAAGRVPHGPGVQDGLQAGLHDGAGAGVPKVCQTEMRACPRTVCRMVPEQCVRHETRTRCYQVPEEKVCQIPYTTCRMVPRTARPRPRRGRAATPCPSTTSATSATRPAAWCPETHVRMVTQRRCYNVPEVKTRADPVHRLPHGQARTTSATRRGGTATRSAETHVPTRCRTRSAGW